MVHEGSDISVRCKGPSVLRSKWANMTVWNCSGSRGVMHAWSTNVPGLIVMQAASQQATGLASVTVHEAGIGKKAYTSRAREERTGYETTDWSSNDQTHRWCARWGRLCRD